MSLYDKIPNIDNTMILKYLKQYQHDQSIVYKTVDDQYEMMLENKVDIPGYSYTNNIPQYMPLLRLLLLLATNMVKQLGTIYKLMNPHIIITEVYRTFNELIDIYPVEGFSLYWNNIKDAVLYDYPQYSELTSSEIYYKLGKSKATKYILSAYKNDKITVAAVRDTATLNSPHLYWLAFDMVIRERIGSQTVVCSRDIHEYLTQWINAIINYGGNADTALTHIVTGNALHTHIQVYWDINRTTANLSSLIGLVPKDVFTTDITVDPTSNPLIESSFFPNLETADNSSSDWLHEILHKQYALYLLLIKDRNNV